jgi:adenine-specific DNA methylase
MNKDRQKCRGAYYTPEPVVHTLVRWAVRRDADRLLDPACGDGRFLTVHPNSVGVEQDPDAASAVHEAAPGALIHQDDFFMWANETCERFECAAGNPPFIRYQRFAGETRKTALNLCAKHGAMLSGLTSSWAPFLIATASLLKPGGRMAFVVPAEIGHAPYARPVLEYLAAHFSTVGCSSRTVSAARQVTLFYRQRRDSGV